MNEEFMHEDVKVLNCGAYKIGTRVFLDFGAAHLTSYTMELSKPLATALTAQLKLICGKPRKKR